MDLETLELQNKIKILEEDVCTLTEKNENLKIENFELKEEFKIVKKLAETIEKAYNIAYEEFKKNE